MHDDMPRWEEVPANADDMPPLEDDMPGLEDVPTDEDEHHEDMPPLEDSSTDEEVEPLDSEDLIIMDELPPEIVAHRPMTSHIFIGSDITHDVSGFAVMTRFISYPMTRAPGPHAAP